MPAATEMPINWKPKVVHVQKSYKLIEGQGTLAISQLLIKRGFELKRVISPESLFQECLGLD
jgi:hypothetical protein